ncbi:hypothetical protein LEP1GSC008_3290, partial [Leptospira kirschneri serovar Bulgarica str. Nikolaevo]
AQSIPVFFIPVVYTFKHILKRCCSLGGYDITTEREDIRL